MKTASKNKRNRRAGIGVLAILVGVMLFFASCHSNSGCPAYGGKRHAYGHHHR